MSALLALACTCTAAYTAAALRQPSVVAAPPHWPRAAACASPLAHARGLRVRMAEDQSSSSSSSSSSRRSGSSDGQSSGTGDGSGAVSVADPGRDSNADDRSSDGSIDVLLDDDATKPAPPSVNEDWSGFLLRERYVKLRDIALTISVRRTIDEAELALKLAADFGADPSILQDIDFVSLIRRVERDLEENKDELQRAQLMPAEELALLEQRQRDALGALQRVQPDVLMRTAEGAVGSAVPKIRRVIAQARELPLTIELPTNIAAEGLDFSLALNESKNVAVAMKEVWQRLNGADVERDLELVSLQRETKALLALRAEVSGAHARSSFLAPQHHLCVPLTP